MNNRLHNCTNPFQGQFKRVLCVCSAGLLRSPTAALVLSAPPFGYNTRSCGLDVDHALIPIDEVLIRWSDEIVCMTQEQKVKILDMIENCPRPVVCLDIGDRFEYREPELIELIADKYTDMVLEGTKNDIRL